MNSQPRRAAVILITASTFSISALVGCATNTGDANKDAAARAANAVMADLLRAAAERVNDPKAVKPPASARTMELMRQPVTTIDFRHEQIVDPPSKPAEPLIVTKQED